MVIFYVNPKTMLTYKLFCYGLLLFFFFAQCGLGNSDNAFSEECENFQELVNTATNEYFDAKNQYNKDPSNGAF